MSNDLGFIIFYSAFVLFIFYVGGLAGYSIISSSEDLSSISLTDFSLNPISAFQTFLTLMFVKSEYLVFGTLLFVPYTIAIIYLGLKWLRGTG